MAKSPVLGDTAPEVATVVRQRLMAFSGAERFLMGCRMFEAARRMVVASLPEELTREERKRRLFERFYGQPLSAYVKDLEGVK